MRALLHLLALLAVSAFVNSAHAQDAEEAAVRAAAFDCLTTADALDALAGAARETNPLGAVPACVIKPLVARYYDGLPEPERTEGLTANRAVWDAAAANNVMVLLHASAAASLGVAAVAGMIVWHLTEPQREFARQCAIHERLAGRRLRCTYTPPHS